MNEESSSGGRGPSSIKPPTIKPPTAQDNEFGATSFSSVTAPQAGASEPLVGAMPQMQQHSPTPSAMTAPPSRQQNLWLWIVAGVLLLGLLIIVIAVVVLLLLR